LLYSWGNYGTQKEPEKKPSKKMCGITEGKAISKWWGKKTPCLTPIDFTGFEPGSKKRQLKETAGKEKKETNKGNQSLTYGKKGRNRLPPHKTGRARTTVAQKEIFPKKTLHSQKPKKRKRRWYAKKPDHTRTRRAGQIVWKKKTPSTIKATFSASEQGKRGPGGQRKGHAPKSGRQSSLSKS